MNGIPAQPLNPPFDQNGLPGSFGQGFGGPNINQNGFDPSQFQNHQGPRFGDGLPNNASPSLHQSPFQVPSVIPAKRTREEQVAASPHPPPTSIGHSRSQTPQQPTFSQYGGQSGPPPFHTPTPFQTHMQQSNHASPSPNPAQQQFRPPSSQPNMASPPHFAGQPGQPGPFPQMHNQMNRMGTPQHPQQHMMQGMGGPPGGMPGGGPMGNMRPGMPGTMAHNEMLQRQYQASLLRQRQMQSGMAQMPPGAQMNGITAQQRAALSGAMNPNMAGRPGLPGLGPNAGAQGSPVQRFMMQLEKTLQLSGQTLDHNPTVSGRPVSFYQIFSYVIKMRPDVNPQTWPAVAASLGLAPEQNPTVVPELRALYDRFLAGFVSQYMAMQIQAKKMQQSNMAQQGSPPNARMPRPGPPGYPGPPPQPSVQAVSPSLNKRRPPSSAADAVDGGTPDKMTAVLDQSSSPHHFPQGSPVQLKIGAQDEPDSKARTDDATQVDGLVHDEHTGKPFDTEYKPRRYELMTFGGLRMDTLAENSTIVHELRTHPRYEELGPVDLHALTMSLQSGFHEEIRYSLDRLVLLSSRPLFLVDCEDLIETLIDLANKQIDDLSKGAESTGDRHPSPSYEQLSTSCRDDLLDFRITPPFGDEDYELRHAIDRLICVTTILRNLSFPVPERSDHDRHNETNRKMLSSPEMQLLWTRIIKLISVQNSSRTRNADLLDLMKDLVVLLSNASEALVLTNEDDARSLVEFLLAFAPSTASCHKSSTMSFTNYDPLKHQYLPNALDSLAKILARDDPNRGYLKNIFLGDLASSTRQEDPLITKAFALAVAPVPESIAGVPMSHSPLRLVEKRKPFISQGMLVLDILSTIVPTTPASHSTALRQSSSLQRLWLESDDGWATRLIHLGISMGMHDAQNAAATERHPVTRELIDNGRGFGSITQRALSTVLRLIEVADRIDVQNSVAKAELVSSKVLGLVPLEDMNFSAMMTPRFDSELLKCLGSLVRLTT